MNSGHVMEKTESVRVDSGTLINVPEGYTAMIFSGGKLVAKCGQCKDKKLKSIIGSSVEGKNISVLYVNKRALTDMSWGVGNIPVVYTVDDRSIEVQVGANGTFLAAIADPVSFYDEYGPEFGELTLPEITGFITSGLRKYARELVFELFSDASEPIIETDFILDEADLRFDERICNKRLEDIPGVIFKKANVGSITVREEDIDALREFYKARRRKK